MATVSRSMSAPQPTAEARTPPNPKARRHSSGRRLSGFPKDFEPLIDENDDDAERNKAAEVEYEKAAQKAQKARSPIKGTPGHQKRQQHYLDVISMADQNVRATRCCASPLCPWCRGAHTAGDGCDSRARPY